MSKLRAAALALGGLLVGAPLLATGTASAGQVATGTAGSEQVATGRQVVFGGGGMLGLSCRSRPDVSSLTVPAESTVRVVNRTGHAATLRLGRDRLGRLPDDGSTEVVFRRGTTAVQLTPSCALGTESTPALITATPEPTGPSAPPSGPGPVPQPTETSSGPPSTPPGTTSPPASDPPSSGAGQPGTTPTGKPTKPTRPTKPTKPTRPAKPTSPSTATKPPVVAQPAGPRPVTPAAVTTVPAMPQGGAAVPKVKTRVLRGTDVSEPTFAGMPPGDKKTIVSGVPTLDLPEISEAAALTPDVPPTPIAAAEPVAEMRPMPESRPIGLLAVIAGVCVLGVGVAAIRAFVSQRASRSLIA